MAEQVKFILHLDNNQLVAAFQQSLREAGVFEKQVNSSTGALQNMGKQGVASAENLLNTFKKVAGVGGVSYVFKQLASEVINVTGQIQKLDIAFEAMLGSKADAQKLMAELVNTAAQTPFGLTDLAQGAKQLLAYGTAGDDVNDTLVRLGNIASGMSIPLNDLVYLYGTTMVQGRLFTNDLRQFQNRGIDLTSGLAKQFGVTKDAVAGLVTDGKVGFAEMQKALMDMTNEGGKFYNFMQKESAAVPGQISNLKDSIQMMFADVGKASSGAISTAISGAQFLVENYEAIGKVLIALCATYGTYRTAMMLSSAMVQGLTVVEHLHYVALVLQDKAQKLLNATMKANPYVLVATLLAGLVTSYLLFRDTTTSAERAQKRLNDEMDAFNKRIQERRASADQLINIVRDETQTNYERLKALKELQALMPGVFDNYTVEKLALEDLTRVRKELNAADSTAGIEAAKKAAEDASNLVASLTERVNETQEAMKREWTPALAHAFSTLSDGLKDAQEQARLAHAEMQRLLDIDYKANTPVEVQKAALEQQLAALEAVKEEIFNRVNDNTVAILDNQEWIDINAQIDAVKSKLQSFGETTAAVITKNKAYWEAEKKRYEEMLEALDPDDAATKQQWDEATKGVLAATAALEKYNASKVSDAAERQAEKNAKALEKEREAAEKTAKARRKADEELAAMMVQLQQRQEQIRISTIEDPEVRRLAELDAEMEQHLQYVEEWRRNLLRILNEGQGEGETALITKLPQETEDALDTYIALVAKAIESRRNFTDPDSVEGLEQRYASQMGDLRKIEEDFATDRKALEALRDKHKEGTAEYQEYTERLVSLEKKKAEAISDLQAKGISEGADFKILFGELEHVSTSAIKAAVANAEKILASTEGLTEERMKILHDLVNKGKKAIADNNPFTALKDAHAAYLKALKDGGNGEEEWVSVVGAAEAIKSTLGEVGDMLGQVFSMFGNDISKTIDKVVTGVGHAINMFEGFGKSGEKSTADIIRGMQGVIGVVTTVISYMIESADTIGTMATATAKANNAVADSIRNAKGAADTFFTTDYANRAKQALAAMRQSTFDLGILMSDLRTAINDKEFLKNHGNIFDKVADSLNFWEKVDVNHLKKIYDALWLFREATTTTQPIRRDSPEAALMVDHLLPSMNDIEKALAEIDVVLAGKLSKTEREIAEAGKSYLESIKASLLQVQEVVTGMVGDISNSLQGALVDAYRSGADGSEAFRKSLDGVMTSLVSSMMFTKLFAADLDALGDTLATSIAAGDTAGVTNNIADFFDSASQKIPAFMDALKLFEDMAKERGFDPFAQEAETTTEGTKSREGSLQAIDAEISKLRKLRDEQSTTHEEYLEYERQIAAFQEQRARITREGQAAEEGSLAYHRERIAVMEKELDLMTDLSTTQAQTLKDAWIAEKAILAEKEKQLTIAPPANTLAGIQAQLNDLRAYRETLLETQKDEIVAVNAAIDEAEAAYARMEKILGIDRSEDPVAVEETALLEGTIAYWEKIESEATERLRHLRADQVAEIDAQIAIIREAAEEKAKIDQVIKPPTTDIDAIIAENKKAYELYGEWVVRYGQELADRQYEDLLKNGASYEEYVNAEIALLEARMSDGLTAAESARLIDLSKQRDDIFNKREADALSAWREGFDSATEGVNGLIDKLAILKQQKDVLSTSGLADSNLSTATTQVDAEIAKTQAAIEKDLLSKYQSAQQKRFALIEQYNKEITFLRQAGYAEAAEAARQALDKELSDMDNAVITASEAWLSLSAGFADMNREAAAAMIAQLREMIANSADLTREAATALLKEVDKAEKALNEKRYDDAISSLNDVSSAIQSVVGGLKELNVLSDTATADLDRIGGVLQGATGILAGLASGNWLSVLQGGVNVAVNLYKLLDFETRRIDAQQKATAASLDQITAAYNRLQRAVQQSVGLETFALQREMIDSLAKQQLALIAQLESEKDRKNPDPATIKAWENEIQALKDKQEDVFNSMYASLVQTDVKSAAGELMDILTGKFSDMKSMMLSVEDFSAASVKRIMKNYLQMQLLEQPLQAILHSLGAEMAESGPTKEMMDRYKEAINKLMKDASAVFESYADMFADEMWDNQLLNAVRGMSEQTGNAIVGLANAMHIAQVDGLLLQRESIQMIQESLSYIEQSLEIDKAIAKDVAAIKQHTSFLPKIFEILNSSSNPLANKGF